MISNQKHYGLFSARRILLFLFDATCFIFVNLAFCLVAYALRPGEFPGRSFLLCGIFQCAVLLLFNLLFNVNKNIWRYSNVNAYLKIVLSGIFGAAGSMVLSYILNPAMREDLYVHIWYFAVTASFFALMRLSSRFIYSIMHKHANSSRNKAKINVAIVGAGQVGAMLADELRYDAHSHYNPLFFIDSDASKCGAYVADLKVYYESEEILSVIHSMPVQEIFIALPGLDNEVAAKMYEFYSRSGCKIKLYDVPVKDIELNNHDNNVRRSLREFQIEDLLFRKSLDVGDGSTFQHYSGKTVLVTGGGGSIGSEICRQLAKCSLKKLIILDIYENNAYDIQQELIRRYEGKLDLAVEIASVRDVKRLDCIFNQYRPDVVFHAAAHKHVPLMEHSGCEAVKNNVLGTYNTANMAEKYGVSKFILISTDKAVNPTNVMGASKRMCEMVIQCRLDSNTKFAAVRFGNVLGSNGSVIPLFKRQIAAGGPITITDKRIIRYFMTIPEASQLVMKAGALAKRGELFVLDMGKPVKIYDLAEKMIRLSGLIPGEDIQIEEIGLRPGEKLYEELLIKTETLTKTENKMIFIEKDAPPTREEVEHKIQVLTDAVKDAENEIGSDKIKVAFKAVVPTYHDPEDVNRCASRAEEMQLCE